MEYPRTRSLALFLATGAGDLEFVLETVMYMPAEELLRSKDNNQMTALHLAVLEGHLEIVKVLVDRMTQEALMAQDCFQMTALHFTADKGHLEIVQVLVDRMSLEALMATDVFHRTSLHCAVDIGHLGIVQALADRMLQKDMVANSHQILMKALQVAQKFQQTSIVEYLSTKYPNL